MRVFSAIKIDNEIIKEISKFLLALENYREKIKVVPAENLHITLRFLGNINQENYNRFSRKLSEEYSKIKSFSVVFRGIGFFPNRNRIKVIWVGIDKNSELQNLYNIAENAACEIGLVPENRFQGHITVGRTKIPFPATLIKDIEKNFKDTFWGKMHIEKITIFESILHADGPEYRELINIPLGGN